MPDMFVPPAFVGARLKRRPNAVLIHRETYLISDLTMPEKDWSIYDQLAKGRFVSDRPKRGKRRKRGKQSNVTPILSALIRRQAT